MNISKIFNQIFPQGITSCLITSFCLFLGSFVFNLGLIMIYTTTFFLVICFILGVAYLKDWLKRPIIVVLAEEVELIGFLSTDLELLWLKGYRFIVCDSIEKAKNETINCEQIPFAYLCEPFASYESFGAKDFFGYIQDKNLNTDNFIVLYLKARRCEFAHIVSRELGVPVGGIIKCIDILPENIRTTKREKK